MTDTEFILTSPKVQFLLQNVILWKSKGTLFAQMFLEKLAK